MAILSSHTLNSVDGTHAGGIAVTLYRIDDMDTRHVVFESMMDDGGRLSQEIPDHTVNTEAQYEMVLKTGAYFADRGIEDASARIVQDVVVRFTMPDRSARYHIPMMLAPNSYSVWWTS